MREWLKLNAVQILTALVFIVGGYQLMEFRLSLVEEVAADIPKVHAKLNSTSAGIMSIEREYNHALNRLDKISDTLALSTSRLDVLESGASANSAIILKLDDTLNKINETLSDIRIHDGVQNTRLDHLERRNR